MHRATRRRTGMEISFKNYLIYCFLSFIILLKMTKNTNWLIIDNSLLQSAQVKKFFKSVTLVNNLL